MKLLGKFRFDIVIDAQIGVLRTIYYDTSAQLQIVSNTAGTIDYENGIVAINDIKILSVTSDDNLIRITLEADEAILESTRNTIITIDETDPISVVVNLTPSE